MAHIVGRGRYVGETYPGGPSSGSGVGPTGPAGADGPTGPAGPVGTIDPGTEDGQTLITRNVPPLTAVWSNDWGTKNNFTRGNWYAGVSEATGGIGEAAGSHVAVQTGSTAMRGIVSAQHSSDTLGGLYFGMKSRGTRAAPAAVQVADVTSKWSGAGYDGANYIPSASISFEVESAIGAGSVPQSIVFKAGTNASPGTRLTLFANAAVYNALFNSSVEIVSVLGVHGTGSATPIAQSGDIRLRSAGGITARNALNTTDFSLIASNASNNIQVGADSVVAQVSLHSTTTLLGAIGGNTQFQVNTTRFEITRPPELSWDRNVIAPTMNQQPRTVVGSGQPLWIHAQSVNAAGANGNGGKLLLSGGKPDGTGVKGSIQVALNLDDTDANTQTMLEAAEVATGRRVLALVRTQVITTTQMPASTGDAVIYVADAQTNPSADAVTGHVYYSDSGRPAWRFNGVNLRLDNTSATAGAGAGTLPATPQEFLTITVNGNIRKVPLYLT